MKKWLLCLALLGVANGAMAGGEVRAAVAGGLFEIDEDAGFDSQADTAGFDIRARVDIDPHFFARGQYLRTQANEIEVDNEDLDIDLDFNTLRLGAGYGGQVGAIRLYGVIEYIDLDLKLDGDDGGDNGYGASVGIADPGKSSFVWNAELSLLDVGGTGGAAFDATVGYRITPAFAVLVGLQSYVFEEDDVELSDGNFTLGGSFTF